MSRVYVNLVPAELYCLMLLQTVRCSVTTCTFSRSFASDGQKIEKVYVITYYVNVYGIVNYVTVYVIVNHVAV